MAGLAAGSTRSRMTQGGPHDTYVDEWRPLAQECWWDRQPNCLCSLHVDDQIELDRQIDWDLTRLSTFEDLVYVTARAGLVGGV